MSSVKSQKTVCYWRELVLEMNHHSSIGRIISKIEICPAFHTAPNVYKTVQMKGKTVPNHTLVCIIPNHIMISESFQHPAGFLQNNYFSFFPFKFFNWRFLSFVNKQTMIMDCFHVPTKWFNEFFFLCFLSYVSMHLFLSTTHLLLTKLYSNPSYHFWFPFAHLNLQCLPLKMVY